MTHGDRAAHGAPSASIVPSAVVYLLLFGAVGCWSAYATVLFADQGLDLATIGLLASVPSAVAIVGAPTWGLVADRLGDVRPPLLAAALWGATAAMLLALQPPIPWVILVVMLLAGGTSGLTPLVDSRTVERLGRQRDRFGQARAFGSLGFILTTLAVGLLVQAAGTTAMLAVYVPALALTGIVGQLAGVVDRIGQAQLRTDAHVAGLATQLSGLAEQAQGLSDQIQRTDSHLDILIEMFERHLREDHGKSPS